MTHREPDPLNLVWQKIAWRRTAPLPRCGSGRIILQFGAG